MDAGISLCLDAIQFLIDMRAGMKDNWVSCDLLIKRAERFKEILISLRETVDVNLDISKINENLEHLKEVLTNVRKFVDDFTPSKVITRLKRAAMFKSYSDELKILNKSLDRCAADLSLSTGIGFEKRRQSDYESMCALFQDLSGKILFNVEEQTTQVIYLQDAIRAAGADVEQIFLLLEETQQSLSSELNEFRKEAMFYFREVERQNQEAEEKYDNIISLLKDNASEVSEKERRKQILSRYKRSSDELSYSLSDIIGHGGFGDVYFGHFSGSKVAIKSLRSENASSFQGQVEDELILLDYLGKSPHIATVYGYTLDTKGMHTIMELANYGSLSIILEDFAQYRAIPPLVSVAWLCDLANAISFLHGKQVKHRDIKPGNILVFHGLQLKLGDFGLAKQHISHQLSKSIAGSTAFMAPEIRNGLRSMFVSDIFSFGMTSVNIFMRKIPALDDAHAQVELAVSQFMSVASSNFNGMQTMKDLLHTCVMYDGCLDNLNKLRPGSKELSRRLFDILQRNGGDPREKMPLSELFGFYIPSENDALKRLLDLNKQSRPLVQGNSIVDVKTAPVINPIVEANNHFVERNFKICSQILVPSHAGPITAVLSMPNRSIATGSKDCTIKIWNGDSHEVEAILLGHTGTINTLICARDGRLISGAADGLINIWNPISRRLVSSMNIHLKSVLCLCELHDGSIASGSKDQTILIWSINNQSTKKVLEGHTGGVFDISPLSSEKIVSGSDDKTIIIWSIDRRAPLQVIAEHLKLVSKLLVFSSEDFLSASDDGSCRRWKFTDNAFRCSAVYAPSEWFQDSEYGRQLNTREAIDSICLLPDNNVAVLCTDKTLRIWDLNNTQTPSRVIQSESLGYDFMREGQARVIAVHDGKILLAGKDTCTYNLLDLSNETSKVGLQANIGHAYCAVQIAYNQLAVGYVDGNIAIWDLFTGTIVKSMKLPKMRYDKSKTYPESCRTDIQYRMIYSLVKLRDGRLLCGCSDSSMSIWETDGACVRHWYAHQGSVHEVLQLANGILVSCSADCSIAFWNMATANKIHSFRAHIAEVRAIVELSPHYLVSSGQSDPVMRIWDCNNYNLVQQVWLGREILCFASLTNETFASVDADGYLCVWNKNVKGVLLWKKPARCTFAHATIARCVIRLQSGKIATAGLDYKIKIWNESFEPAVIDGPRSAVMQLIELSDGRIATVHIDGSVRVWG